VQHCDLTPENYFPAFFLDLANELTPKYKKVNANVAANSTLPAPVVPLA
jgi:hypothetical protein